MPASKHLIRYHSRAMAAIHERKRLQKPPLSRWQIDSPQLQASLYLSDRVKKYKKTSLHAGLEITVISRGDDTDLVFKKASGLVESVLNIR